MSRINSDRKKSYGVTAISQRSLGMKKFGTNLSASEKQRMELARRRGIAEHALFEEEVDYYYKKKGLSASIWYYAYTAFVFGLTVALLAVFFS